MSTQRIHWIDITKGFLILLVVLGHICNIASNQGVDSANLIKCLPFTSIYTCFFMQAFIILTGYTSNFDKNTKDFLTSLTKTVIIPWVVFAVICQVYRICVYNSGLFFNINGQKYFFLIEEFWFLHVLFFGKLLYYLIYHCVKNDPARAGILLALMFCGFAIFSLHNDTENTYHFNNFLHYKDLLCMSFFFWFGNYCKRKSLINNIKGKHFVVILLLYLLGHIIRYIFRARGLDELLIAPVVISHGGNAVSPLQVPAYLYYVLLGSLSCFGIMQYLNKSGLFEYIGRNSLLVYCIHFIFLDIVIRVMNIIIPPVDIISAALFLIISLFLTMSLCFMVAYITRYKPFNYLIGKF